MPRRRMAAVASRCIVVWMPLSAALHRLQCNRPPGPRLPTSSGRPARGGLVAGRRRWRSATPPTLLLTTALYMLDRTALCSLARTSIVAAQSLTYSPYHCRGHSYSVRWPSAWLSWHGRIHPTADRPLHRASGPDVQQEGCTTIAAAGHDVEPPSL